MPIRMNIWRAILSVGVFVGVAAFLPLPAGATDALPNHCHSHNTDYSISCPTPTKWCGSTCQPEPAISGNQAVNCTSCAATCQAAYPCNFPSCTAPSATVNVTQCTYLADGTTPNTNCPVDVDGAGTNSTVGVYTNQCSLATSVGCPAGYSRCSQASPAINSCAKVVTCPSGYNFEPCAGTPAGSGGCVAPYIVTNPGAQQNAFINVSGEITSGGTVTATGVQVDPNYTNTGAFNPSNMLRLGAGSVGIGSQNSAGSLDLYTSGLKRLSILSSGTLTFPQLSAPYALQTSNASLYVGAYSGYPGVVSYGSYAGGYFQNTSSGANAYLGYGSYPIYASGPCAGFFTGVGGTAYLSCSGYAGTFNGLVYAQQLQLPGASTLRIGTSAVSGYVLTTDAGGYASWQEGFGGSGTANYLPKFLGAKTIGNSTIYQSVAGNVGIGTAAPTYAKLDVRDTNTVVQARSAIPALVTGSNNGGAIYFGVDNTNTATVPTAAIETSWGGGTNPQMGIGVTRDGTGANILMEYAGGGVTTFRNGATPTMAIDGPGNVTANKDLNAPTGCFGPKFIGRAAATTGVIAGGYNGANAMCAALGAGAHVCSVDEIFMSIKCGAVTGLADNDAMWINGGPPGYLAPANDCTGWTNGSGSAYGRKWIWVGSNSGRGALGTCNESIPLGCCR